MHGFSVNTNFAADAQRNQIMSRANEEFDKEMEKRQTKAEDDYISANSKPKVDPSTLSQKERELKLKELGALDKDNKGKGKSRLTDESKAFGDIADGFRNLGTAIGLGNRTTGASGFVDADGKFHPRTCFTKGTLVHTLNGTKPIEEIKVGEVVLSWNEKTGKNEYKKVVNTFERKTDLIYILKIGKDKLETTWNHPFYVKEKGWVQAKDLKLEDNLMSSKGELLPLLDITIEEEEQTVYNFEVQENHTYYVGEDGVLVHNDGKCSGLFGATLGRYTNLKDTKIENENAIPIKPKKVLPDLFPISENERMSKVNNGLENLNEAQANSLQKPLTKEQMFKIGLAKAKASEVGEKSGYMAEMESKIKARIVSKEEIASYLSVSKKLDIINSAETKLRNGQTLSPTELASYKTNLQGYRDIEKNHSEQIVQNWIRQGKTGVAPLTPYAKLIMKEQHPDVNLEKVKLINSGFVRDTLQKVTGGNASAITIFNNVYNLNTSTSHLPGGFDQNSNVQYTNNIGVLSHELTHTPQ